MRWYAISLLAPPLILLLTATALYGRATLRALGQNWLLTLTSFLPALVVMIVFNSVAEEIGWTGARSRGSKIVTVHFVRRY